MSEHFYNFILEMHESVELFKEYWEKNHKENPQNFPMSFLASNTGAWFEQFILFCESEDFFEMQKEKRPQQKKYGKIMR